MRWIREARQSLNLSSDEVAESFVRKHGHRVSLRPVRKWRRLLDNSLEEFGHWFGNEHFRSSSGGCLALLEKAKFSDEKAFALFLQLTGGVRDRVHLGDVDPRVIGDALVECNFNLDKTARHLISEGFGARRTGPRRRPQQLPYCRLCGWSFASSSMPGKRSAASWTFCDNRGCLASFRFCVGCMERMDKRCISRQRCRGCGTKLSWVLPLRVGRVQVPHGGRGGQDTFES